MEGIIADMIINEFLVYLPISIIYFTTSMDQVSLRVKILLSK